ncbi:MAG: tRNA guanosine(34) transglycosylase Tgt [Deltaproteobacteria bacterium]|nr:tRNA guanosine(34) transglycosylase Tgt [Deltaproteobacteria bacterium]
MPPFRLLNKERTTQARRGEITTPHGTIATPVFMPVGTAATVKAVTSEELEALGAEIILGNTYHLMLRPGEKVVEKLGGLHQFMGWQRPILTDSGGYQVFSLALRRKILPEGVCFQSHIDGDEYFLTPQRAIEIQEALGSDIAMVLDECTPYPATREEAEKSMRLSLEWAKKSLIAKSPFRPPLSKGETGGFLNRPLLFGIIQGGFYPDLRKNCLDELASHPFDGLALGGLSVGEPQEACYTIGSEITPLLPADKPRYLMGMGLPEDIVEAVGWGVDMFDCVIPTRNARNGQLFTPSGPIQIKQTQYREDPRPIDENCSCPVCKKYSRAYLRHLYLAKEILSPCLNTIHNLHFYLDLMRRIRRAIEENRYSQFKKEFYAKYSPRPNQ